MREVHNPHEIEARWQGRCSQVDLDYTARPFYNLVAPWGLRLHSAKVGGVMPLTLPYAHVG